MNKKQDQTIGVLGIINSWQEKFQKQETCKHKNRVTTHGGGYIYRTACKDCGKVLSFKFKK